MNDLVQTPSQRQRQQVSEAQQACSPAETLGVLNTYYETDYVGAKKDHDQNQVESCNTVNANPVASHLRVTNVLKKEAESVVSHET